MKEVIAIASDHAGYSLKESLKRDLLEQGFDVLDLGCADTSPVDYPVFATALADAIAREDAVRGVLVCGSGIGISIAANDTLTSGRRSSTMHLVPALPANITMRTLCALAHKQRDLWLPETVCGSFSRLHSRVDATCREYTCWAE